VERVSLFIRGTVLRHADWVFEDRYRDKFIVVVSLASTADPIVCVMTTSKLAYFRRHPESAVFVAADELTAWPLETAIDCRELYRLSRADLLSKYDEGKLQYCHTVPRRLLAEITEKLAASPHLSPAEKAEVVPPQS